ncbi:DNA repair protein complementing XP-G cells homolog [Culex quinquefasciatus]|uniref:DNA repair protein complementing XP-G cells homolog n=1 Tax=Culex quinquefasciatus TaxID=7176 RepID=UPI0018E3F24E|nr:DNA repair protein complementing XP-G cells homolog [Culex quinquefasciatus]
MGVTGLWKLVEQSGKPVPLETLENKVLAVDISIWLHQVTKGFQDSKGSALPNAHVLGLFHRLCKLMYYRIRPVFVFDGGVPALKRQTIAKRNQSKSKFHNEADRLQQLLLETLAKEKVVQQALGSATSLLVSPSKKPGNSSKEQGEPDEMFKLPPLKEDSPFKNADSSATDLDESNSSWDEKGSKNFYHLNLNAIDVTSVHFKNLPADVRHDILSDIKETRKQSSWGRLHELPVESNNFSTFQMKRLLKRRTVQVELEEAEKEMGGKCLSLAELEALLSEEGVDTSSDKAAQKIASDENTRFLLVRDVQKAIEKAKQREEEEKNAPKPPKLPKVEIKKSDDREVEDDKEMDAELQMAIQMSLMQDVDPNVVIELESEEVRMSRQQKEALGGAAMSLARGYMLEYGGMSNDDVRELLHQTQDVDPGEVEQSFTQMFEHNNASILKGTLDPVEEVQEVSSDTDSDFVDVPEDDLGDSPPGVLLPLNPSNHQKPHFGTVVDFTLNDLPEKAGSESKLVEIFIEPSKIGLKDEDDIFADVFEVKEEEKAVKVDEKPVETKLPTIQIKKVDDINAKLKEELERLKAAPPVIDLDNILSQPLIPKVDSKPAPPEAVHDQVKQQLEQLKSQTPQINLDDIKLDSSLVDEPVAISDAEDSDATVGYSPIKAVQKALEATGETTFKIIQSDEAKPQEVVPLLGTPKKGTLEHLVVSRTPGSDSKKSEPEEDIPKVPQPFFVNKTPTSSSKKKSAEDQPTPTKAIKVSKELFPVQDPEPLPSTSSAPPPSADQLISEMAGDLKQQATPLELKKMSLNLAQQERELEKEKNRQARLGMSITEQMQQDCMDLLKLFGVPFIVAPMEAEAQCAFLNQIELTDGTITDDSDIWLFGGKTVYKNFFNQQKLVMEFTIEGIERAFQMDRKKLIQLALLVGSDYTTGISGIGAVTALEVLASFPPTPEKDGETTEMMSLLSGLRKFRDWWNHGRNNSVGTRITLKSKLKNIEFTEGFPSSAIVEAYLYPTVDGNKDAFSWGYPDTESLRDFAKQKFGWPQAKTDDILLPVLKRLDERKSQSSIKNYFKVQSAVAHNQVKVSKRVQQAVDVMAGKEVVEQVKSPKKKVVRKRKPKAEEPKEGEVICLSEPDSDEDFVVVPKKAAAKAPAARKPRATRAKAKADKTTPDVPELPDKPSSSLANISGIISKINDQSADKLGDQAAAKEARKKAVQNKIPDFNPAIPQRVKDQEEMANRKQKAAELFKKTQAKGKKTHK